MAQIKDNYDYEYYAYFDTKSSKRPIWRLTDKETKLTKLNLPHIRFKGVPTPMTRVGKKVYVPTKFWYETKEIKDIEPVFVKDKFDRFLYCIGKDHQLAMSKDFFISKSDAIKHAWLTTILTILYKLTGKL